mmetsp:Transcript_19172/g.22134  ORF Transcript_19172/g.22134 Transcript_19172/m.22134 type:complete len:200 (-) Transcript_19172:407-1006(-)
MHFVDKFSVAKSFAEGLFFFSGFQFKFSTLDHFLFVDFLIELGFVLRWVVIAVCYFAHTFFFKLGHSFPENALVSLLMLFKFFFIDLLPSHFSYFLKFIFAAFKLWHFDVFQKLLFNFHVQRDTAMHFTSTVFFLAFPLFLTLIHAFLNPGPLNLLLLVRLLRFLPKNLFLLLLNPPFLLLLISAFPAAVCVRVLPALY